MEDDSVSDCHFKFTLLWSVKPCFRFIHPEPGWSQEAEEAIQSLDKQLQSEPRFQRPLKDTTIPEGATAHLTCVVNGIMTELGCTSLNIALLHTARQKLYIKYFDCAEWVINEYYNISVCTESDQVVASEAASQKEAAHWPKSTKCEV